MYYMQFHPDLGLKNSSRRSAENFFQFIWSNSNFKHILNTTTCEYKSSCSWTHWTHSPHLRTVILPFWHLMTVECLCAHKCVYLLKPTLKVLSINVAIKKTKKQQKLFFACSFWIKFDSAVISGSKIQFSFLWFILCLWVSVQSPQRHISQHEPYKMSTLIDCIYIRHQSNGISRSIAEYNQKRPQKINKSST